MLSAEEIQRYARHVVLKDFGGPAQQKLKAAKVLVIGAGGLGAPVLQYLAAAGVGTLGVVDDDEVSLSNLQRQVIHSTSSVGAAKVESAAAAIAEINPHVEVNTYNARFTEENAEELIAAHDIVLDGSDNFDTRYLASDMCYHGRKPLVTAAVNQYDGVLTTLIPHEVDAEGIPYPTYRCIFPQKPEPGAVPTCEEAGVLGALTGIMGSMQALEAIKMITGVGECLIGRLLLVDTRSMRFETIRYKWDPSNPLNGR